MAGEWAPVNKPSRSDEVLDADQQKKLAEQVRSHFDAIAPKRPVKPNRSESDPNQPSIQIYDPAFDGSIPELDNLRSLQSQAPAIFPGEGAPVVQDEFVETQYYDQLVSMDKNHHTTGSGFIKVRMGDGEDDVYDIEVQGGLEDKDHADAMIRGFKSNPATNDWIPRGENQVDYVSSKPNRSESS